VAVDRLEPLGRPELSDLEASGRQLKAIHPTQRPAGGRGMDCGGPEALVQVFEHTGAVSVGLARERTTTVGFGVRPEPPMAGRPRGERADNHG
jgi:hypothetical protein